MSKVTVQVEYHFNGNDELSERIVRVNDQVMYRDQMSEQAFYATNEAHRYDCLNPEDGNTIYMHNTGILLMSLSDLKHAKHRANVCRDTCNNRYPLRKRRLKLLQLIGQFFKFRFQKFFFGVKPAPV